MGKMKKETKLNMGEVISFGRHSKHSNVPVVLTHDQDGRYVSIPEGLRFKRHNETWLEYCARLWRGVYEANGRDDIKITVHLKITESDRMLHELNQWAFWSRRVDGGSKNLDALVNNRLAVLQIHGINFKMDLVE